MKKFKLTTDLEGGHHHHRSHNRIQVPYGQPLQFGSPILPAIPSHVLPNNGMLSPFSRAGPVINMPSPQGPNFGLNTPISALVGLPFPRIFASRVKQARCDCDEWTFDETTSIVTHKDKNGSKINSYKNVVVVLQVNDAKTAEVFLKSDNSEIEGKIEKTDVDGSNTLFNAAKRILNKHISNKTIPFDANNIKYGNYNDKRYYFISLKPSSTYKDNYDKDLVKDSKEIYKTIINMFLTPQ